MNEERLYFAYGSNMNLSQMARRCPEAVAFSPAVLHDYKLAFRGHGVATIIPCKGESVPGLLWHISPDSEASLDRYEGVSAQLYGKREVAVTDPTGETHRAMVYIMNPRYRAACPPTPWYLKGIREGYAAFSISTEPLFKAVRQALHAVRERHESPSKR